MRELLRIEVPHYITHVRVSAARPENHYTKSKGIPMRYRNEHYGFNNYNVLVNKQSGEAVVANPRTAGKPRFKKISGQEILTGKVSPLTRATMIREMKRFYRAYMPKRKQIRQACRIKLELHNTIGEGNQDLDNMSWVMVKVIQDVLVEAGILPEDNITVIKGFEVVFVPLQPGQGRKLVIIIYAWEPVAAVN